MPSILLQGTEETDADAGAGVSGGPENGCNQGLSDRGGPPEVKAEGHLPSEGGGVGGGDRGEGGRGGVTLASDNVHGLGGVDVPPCTPPTNSGATPLTNSPAGKKGSPNLRVTVPSDKEPALRYAQVSKESCLYGKRDLFIRQKRPIEISVPQVGEGCRGEPARTFGISCACAGW